MSSETYTVEEMFGGQQGIGKILLKKESKKIEIIQDIVRLKGGDMKHHLGD